MSICGPEILASLERLLAAEIDGSLAIQEPDVREEEVPSDPTYPQSFDEYVGQTSFVRLMRMEVEACRLSSRRLRHLAFYGPPGTGKTAMAYVLAGELNMAMYESSGAEFQTQKETLEALARIARLRQRSGKNVLLLVDEIDGMARIASYPLFSLMTGGYVTVTGTKLWFQYVAVVGTTNRMSGIPPALRSRFQEAVYVGFYSAEELSRIALQAAHKYRFILTPGGSEVAARNAAGEPRKVTRKILENVANILLTEGRAEANEEVVIHALELSGLRPGGLSESQYGYLSFLASAPKGAAGIASIGAYLGMEARDIQFNEEPYLIRSRMVNVAKGGRQIAEKGFDYLTGGYKW